MLAHDDDAILLERATGTRSLAEYARNGRDDEATRIICDVLARAARQGSPRCARWNPGSSTRPMAQAQGGILADCARHARALLDDPRDPAVLHGDVHHDNILDFGERGWLVIDPKRCMASAPSTTPTSSAIRIWPTPGRRSPSCRAASTAASR